MGMDVVGKAAVSERGQYFRNNVWWWRPLWDYCQRVSPVCREVSGQYNDGDGLDAAGAAQLAKDLFTEINSGRTAEYAAARQIEIDQLPLEPCDICHGTGERNDDIVQGECNGCRGSGTRKPWAAMYPFSLDTVQEFAEFVQDSGGFQIW